jgi:hypothetical protein
MEQKTSAVAAGAMVAAVVCYIAICTGNPGWGLVLSLLSLPLGLVGLLWSASPRAGGGAVSIFAMLLGVVGVVLSILGLLGVLLVNILD